MQLGSYPVGRRPVGSIRRIVTLSYRTSIEQSLSGSIRSIGKILSTSIGSTFSSIKQVVKNITINFVNEFYRINTAIDKFISITIDSIFNSIKQTSKTFSFYFSLNIFLTALRAFQNMMTVYSNSAITLSRAVNSIFTIYISNIISSIKEIALYYVFVLNQEAITIKEIAKNFVFNNSIFSTLQRATNSIIRISLDQIAHIIKMVSVIFALSINVFVFSSRVKAVNLLVTAAFNQTILLAQNISKIIYVDISNAISIIKNMSLSFVIAVTNTLRYDYIKAAPYVVTIYIVDTFTSSNIPGKTIIVPINNVLSNLKYVSKTIRTYISHTMLRYSGVGKMFISEIENYLSIIKSSAKIMQIDFTQSIDLRKSILKIILVMLSLVVLPFRIIEKTITVFVSQTTSIYRSIEKVIDINIANAINSIKNINATIIVPILQEFSITKLISKSLQFSMNIESYASSIRNYFRTFTNRNSQSIHLNRSISKTTRFNLGLYLTQRVMTSKIITTVHDQLIMTQKSISKSISAVIGNLLAVSRSISKQFTARIGNRFTRLKEINKLLGINFENALDSIAGVNKSVSITQPLTTRFVKSGSKIFRIILLSQLEINAIKHAVKTFVITTSNSLNILKGTNKAFYANIGFVLEFTRQKAYNVIATFVDNLSMSLIRSYPKTFTIWLESSLQFIRRKVIEAITKIIARLRQSSADQILASKRASSRIVAKLRYSDEIRSAKI